MDPASGSPDPNGERTVLKRRTRGHIESYGQGRTCLEPGCDTALSRYNKEALCWQHLDELQRAKR
jgi:hypothetical protein